MINRSVIQGAEDAAGSEASLLRQDGEKAGNDRCTGTEMGAVESQRVEQASLSVLGRREHGKKWACAAQKPGRVLSCTCILRCSTAGMSVAMGRSCHLVQRTRC